MRLEDAIGMLKWCERCAPSTSEPARRRVLVDGRCESVCDKHELKIICGVTIGNVVTTPEHANDSDALSAWDDASDEERAMATAKLRTAVAKHGDAQ